MAARTTGRATIGGTAVAVVLLSPYLVMLFTSLKPASELSLTPGRLLPQDWRFDNYVTMWQAAPVARYMLNSLVVASSSTLLVLLIAVPAAYASARFAFPGRRLYLFAMLVVQMLAPVALIVGLYREFASFRALDNLGSLVVINTAFNLAFAIWLLRGFILTIPASLEEAAWIDGCSRQRALLLVVLPVIRPGLVTVAVYAFIAAWNEFIVALTLITTEAKKPLQVGLTQFIGKDEVEWQHLFATSLVAIVPVVVLFLLVEKHLVGGLTAGSVK
ncbi:carbohydrate ABC transporter permease [Pedococcus sp. 5OH_020]|uniref:carbohydrate ABC transporter permease n=1 Tax=Pedococcus sp. 5OH_020 TaxID=2989814 RepID=UPI0022EA0200|nr:carbohydrate ABC transporter permease [Pedococcus sp. 5OH_020]